MVTLIHNVLTTDYVIAIHDDDCLVGLELLECHGSLLESTLKMPKGSVTRFQGLFGISTVCNILAAIQLARHLGLGPEDNVLTIATDGFDRYPSVLAKLVERMGPVLERSNHWFEKIFRDGAAPVLDVRSQEQKERLFAAKEEVWSGFGYSQTYLDRMKSQSFWDAEFERIPALDEQTLRERTSNLESLLVDSGPEKVDV